ncbi:MAG: dephospho-CoA kinase, partial [Chitinophagaceae bacterium]
MYKVGITGGIGSGKSTVAKIFACLGIPVFDADIAAKNIMETNAAVKNAITQLLGKQSYIDGSLNRNFISSQVFP